jgi:multidrug efflux system outer membrane protein
MPKFRSGTAAALVMLLAGCASTSPRADLDMSLPRAWSNAPGGSNAPMTRDSVPHPSAGWWYAFRDPALNTLIDTAVQSNLTIAAAAEHLRAARALLPTGAAPYRPGVSFAAGAAPSPDAKNSYYETGFDATWELPLFDRAANATRAFGADAAAAEADLMAARTSVAAEVASAYFAAQAAARRQSVLRELDDGEQLRVARLRTRVRLRLEPSAIQRSAEADLLAVQASEIEPDAIRNMSLQRIAALLGRTSVDATWLGPAAAPVFTPAVNLESTPADLLRERPDVRHAEAAVLRAAADLGIAQAELLPHVSLIGAITTATRVSGLSLGASNSVVSAGPAISVPLFDWGMRRAARDARAAELSAATMTYRQTVFAALADVEITLVNLERTTRTVELLRNAAASRAETARRSVIVRQVGLTESGEQARSQRDALEARLNLLDAEYAGHIAIVQLHKALGGAIVPGES